MSFDPNEKRPAHCWILKTYGGLVGYACAHCKSNPGQRIWRWTPEDGVRVRQSQAQHLTHCWFVRNGIAA